MAHNTTPLSGVERVIQDGEFIISKTDTKGIITYANEVFIKLSGYTEAELIGVPHNILRHPDMPRCVFKYLWDQIALGNEVLAYVINKSKNGDHYWVYAHVTPSFSMDNKIIGYLSSRRPPSRVALEAIKPIYKALLAEEAKHSSPKDGMQAGMDLLLSVLRDKNVSYSEFVLTI